MEITFATKKLMKQMNDSREMVKVHGAKRAKKLQIVLTQLLAALTSGRSHRRTVLLTVAMN